MARARATARHPQGWFVLVEQLAAAPDRGTFLRRMLDLQCKIVAAEYGAIWTRGEDKPILSCAWPENISAGPPDDNPVMRLLSEAAASGFETNVSHVLHVDQDGTNSQTGIGAHAFVTTMRRGGQVDAVVTAVAHVSDAQVIQSTAAVREVAAGLYDGFEARQDAARQRADAQRVRRAMALLAVSQEAPGFEGACLNLVNELAQQLRCGRVGLGSLRGRQVKLVALNETENLKRHSEQVALMEMAMAECLDQQQPIVYPLPEDAEPLLSQAVVYAHRRLAAQPPGQHVLSVPLRDRDEWLGVLTLQRGDKPFEADVITQMQLTADVLTPELADRRRGDRNLAVHAWHAIRDMAALLVGPKQVVWKLAVLTVLGALIYCLLGSWPYRISAPFVIEPQHKHIVSAPFEGAIESVEKEKGQSVQSGAVLARFETYRLRLEREKAVTNRSLYEDQKKEARGRGDTATANQYANRVERENANVELLDDKIRRASLVSPADGWILAGRWRDKLGSIVEQGQPMFEIAPIEDPDDLIAVVYVHEEDIDQLRYIRQSTATDGNAVTGEMATRSEPQRTYDIKVNRIVPMAQPVEGANSFEVRCTINQPGHSLRPGMQGTAKLNAGRKRVAWILTHRIVDTLRLWMWY